MGKLAGVSLFFFIVVVSIAFVLIGTVTGYVLLPSPSGSNCPTGQIYYNGQCVSGGTVLSGLQVTTGEVGGVGTVVSDVNGYNSDTGIDCGKLYGGGETRGYCYALYEAGTAVTLTATPDEISEFAGWTGCTPLTVDPLMCTVTIKGPAGTTSNIGAKFVVTTQKGTYLRTRTTGAGTGTITCDGTDSCPEAVKAGTKVTLFAMATSGNFAGWTGCTPLENPLQCEVTVDSETTVTAEFSNDFELNIHAMGPGKVTGTGIDCREDTCSKTFTVGTTPPVVTLTATANTGYVFRGWSDACTGTGTTCKVTMDDWKSVYALFGLSNSYLVDVIMTGTGVGTVKSNDGKIDCGEKCARGYDEGAYVVLNAFPEKGSVFKGWTGACVDDSLYCHITVNMAKRAFAQFEKEGTSGQTTTTGSTPAPAQTYSSTPTAKFTEKLTVVPSKFGKITGNGINCGLDSITKEISGTQSWVLQTFHTVSDCTKYYAKGAKVSLTMVPIKASLSEMPNPVSGKWILCGGTPANSQGKCELTMDGEKIAHAHFSYSGALLLTVKRNLNLGKVVSDDHTINCGLDGRDSNMLCDDYANVRDEGDTLILSAVPDKGAFFKSWSNCPILDGLDCSIDWKYRSDRTITANFIPSTAPKNNLIVQKAGLQEEKGSGRVISSDGLIDFTSGQAIAQYPEGAQIELWARPNDLTRSEMVWKGCTKSEGAWCMVTMGKAAKTVQVYFFSNYDYKVSAAFHNMRGADYKTYKGYGEVYSGPKEGVSDGTLYCKGDVERDGGTGQCWWYYPQDYAVNLWRNDIGYMLDNKITAHFQEWSLFEGGKDDRMKDNPIQSGAETDKNMIIYNLKHGWDVSYKVYLTYSFPACNCVWGVWCPSSCE